MPLGEIVVSSSLWLYLSGLLGLVKDIALPLVIAVLGYLFSRMEKRRDQQREDAARKQEEDRKTLEADREKRRRLEERQQARVSQTWNLMLPQSHLFATRYYARILAPVRMLAQLGPRYATQSGDKQSATLRKLAFSWLLFVKHFRRLRDERGGFYFKNRSGEEALSWSVSRLTLLFHGGDEKAQVEIDAALGLLPTNPTYGEFLRLLAERKELPPAVACVRAWLESERLGESVVYLRGFAAILEFEMNRPYEYWYQEDETLPLDAQAREELIRLVERDAEGEGAVDLPGKLKRYLEMAAPPTAAKP